MLFTVLTGGGLPGCLFFLILTVFKIWPNSGKE